MALNTWRPAGVNNNWSNSLNWSQLAVPTASDTFTTTFDANVLSGPCTVDGSARVCQILDMSAYNNTITMTNQITVSGDTTLGASMTVLGSGALIISGSRNATSNGFTWPSALTLSPGGGGTITMVDNWVVSGLLTFSIGAGSNGTINGSQITFSGNLTFSGGGGALAGTTLLIANGSSTVTTGATMRLPLTINTAGTIILPATFLYSGATLTYTAGTVDLTTNTTVLTCSSSTTFACSGITWKSVNFNTGGTITLNEDFYYTGTLSAGLTGTGNNLVLTGRTIHHTGSSGGYTITTTGTVSGTTNISMEGTGNLTGIAGGETRNNFTINTSGTYTFVTAWGYDTGTFTVTAGTMAGSVPLSIQSSATTTFTGTQNITWTTITVGAGTFTVTLSDSLTCSGAFITSATSQVITLTGGNMYIGGGMTSSQTTGTITGTTILNLTGTGTLAAASETTGRLLSKLKINAPGGTITINTLFLVDTGNVLYTAGTVVTSYGTWVTGSSSSIKTINGLA